MLKKISCSLLAIGLILLSAGTEAKAQARTSLRTSFTDYVASPVFRSNEVFDLRIKLANENTAIQGRDVLSIMPIPLEVELVSGDGCAQLSSIRSLMCYFGTVETTKYRNLKFRLSDQALCNNRSSVPVRFGSARTVGANLNFQASAVRNINIQCTGPMDNISFSLISPTQARSGGKLVYELRFQNPTAYDIQNLQLQIYSMRSDVFVFNAAQSANCTDHGGYSFKTCDLGRVSAGQSVRAQVVLDLTGNPLSSVASISSHLMRIQNLEVLASNSNERTRIRNEIYAALVGGQLDNGYYVVPLNPGNFLSGN